MRNDACYTLDHDKSNDTILQMRNEVQGGDPHAQDYEARNTRRQDLNILLWDFKAHAFPTISCWVPLFQNTSYM